jgi:hypothetical protein
MSGSPYQELAGLLNQAAVAIDALSELSIFCPFDSPGEFSGRIRALAARVRAEEHVALRELITLFAPTGAWDDAMGAEGIDLAERVMALLDLLRWNAT